jgi:hypothetical protein
VTGTVTIDAAANLTLDLGFVPVLGTSFVVINNDGADVVTGEYNGLADDSTFNLTDTGSGATLVFSINYQGGDGNDVAITLVQPATVTGVFVRGTNWTSGFLDALESDGLGDATLGFEIETGSSDQDKPLPWGNIDQISIVYSEDVAIDASDVRLAGVNVTDYGFTFSYDASDATVTLTLDAPLGVDKVLVDIGDFHFRFNSMPGDADGDGIVGSTDLNILLTQFGTSTGIDPRADMDGDVIVGSLDLNILLTNFGTMLPTGTPSHPTGNGARVANDNDTESTSIVITNDLGDAPDTFGTLLASNSESHVATAPTLGASRDSDTDGQPTVMADGDDLDGTDDEDGITFPSAIIAGDLSADVTVNASGSALTSAKPPSEIEQSVSIPKAIGRVSEQTDAGAAGIDLIAAAGAGRAVRGQNAAHPASQRPLEASRRPDRIKAFMPTADRKLKHGPRLPVAAPSGGSAALGMPWRFISASRHVKTSDGTLSALRGVTAIRWERHDHDGQRMTRPAAFLSRYSESP